LHTTLFTIAHNVFESGLVRHLAESSTGPKLQFAASLTAMSNIDHTCEQY